MVVLSPRGRPQGEKLPPGVHPGTPFLKYKATFSETERRAAAAALAPALAPADAVHMSVPAAASSCAPGCEEFIYDFWVHADD